jgi:organic radical activating enzyme
MKPPKKAPKHYCPYPFTQITTTPTGLWKLCCSASEAHGFVSDFPGQLMNSINEVSLKDYWNGDYLNWVREKHLEGRPIKECEACFSYEMKGNESYRQRALDERGVVTEFTKNPVSLDLKLGNLCNAACLFCDPSSSSRILQEWKKIGWDKNVPFDTGLTGTVDSSLFKTDYDWPLREEFWEEIKEISPGLKNIKFTGGEPLINPHMIKYLKFLVENNYASNIRLQTTSNGIKIPDEFLQLTQHFKEVQLNFSVDGYKSQNEYIRYPTKWDSWLRNIQKVRSAAGDNTQLYFQHSFGAYSLFGLVDLFKWMWEFKDFRFHLFKVHNPEFQQSEVIDKTTVLKVVDEFSQLITQLEKDISCERDELLITEMRGLCRFLEGQSDKSHLLPELRKFIKTLDKHRGHSIENFIPKMAEYLQSN